MVSEGDWIPPTKRVKGIDPPQKHVPQGCLAADGKREERPTKNAPTGAEKAVTGGLAPAYLPLMKKSRGPLPNRVAARPIPA